jgi:hypothetical protein
MGFETMPAASDEEKRKDIPKDLEKKGMLLAGEETVPLGDTRPAESVAPRKSESGIRVETLTASEAKEYFFPKGAEENLNQAAAFESLLNEGVVSMEEIVALKGAGTERLPAIQRALAGPVNEYLGAWRSTAGDKQKRIEQARRNFVEAVKGELH